MTLTLTRTKTGSSGTFGLLSLSNGINLFTGELPWKNNLPNVSCIPAGTYHAALAYMPHFQRNMYLLESIPSRNSVFIHPGNWCGDVSLGLKSDVLGCICLGESLGILAGQDAVVNSGEAVENFMEFLNGAEFDLTIVDAIV